MELNEHIKLEIDESVRFVDFQTARTVSPAEFLQDVIKQWLWNRSININGNFRIEIEDENFKLDCIISSVEDKKEKTEKIKITKIC